MDRIFPLKRKGAANAKLMRRSRTIPVTFRIFLKRRIRSWILKVIQLGSKDIFPFVEFKV